MIQNRIHQIWFQGWNYLPEKYVDNVKSIIDKNPTYTHFKWDDTSIRNALRILGPEYLAKYHSFNLIHQKIDFSRYAILYLYGGVSVDTDVVAIKGFDSTPFADTSDFIVSYNSANKFESYIKSGLPFTINNATILVKKNHPILKNLLNQILSESCDINQSDYSCIQSTTGPAAFTEYLNQYKDQITILNNKYFEPCSGADLKCELPSEAILDHQHEASWVNPIWKKAAELYYVAKRNKFALILLLIIIPILIFIPKYRTT